MIMCINTQLVGKEYKYLKLFPIHTKEGAMCHFFSKRTARVQPAEPKTYNVETQTEIELAGVRIIPPRRNSVYVGTPPFSARSLTKTTEGSISYSDLYRRGDIPLHTETNPESAARDTQTATQISGTEHILPVE